MTTKRFNVFSARAWEREYNKSFLNAAEGNLDNAEMALQTMGVDLRELEQKLGGIKFKKAQAIASEARKLFKKRAEASFFAGRHAYLRQLASDHPATLDKALAAVKHARKIKDDSTATDLLEKHLEQLNERKRRITGVLGGERAGGLGSKFVQAPHGAQNLLLRWAEVMDGITEGIAHKKNVR
jgi:hypothetical protein